jgi:hypothetical protein
MYALLVELMGKPDLMFPISFKLFRGAWNLSLGLMVLRSEDVQAKAGIFAQAIAGNDDSCHGPKRISKRQNPP